MSTSMRKLGAALLWMVASSLCVGLMSPSVSQAQIVCDGTPDAFDYLCTEGASSFEAVPNNANVNSDDTMVGPIPIGFTFNYYEVDYTNVFISSNGFISFLAGQSNGCCSGQPIPSTGNPNAIIAGVWTDLNPRNGGSVTTGLLGEQPNQRFVISFNDVPYFSGGGVVNFQIVLHTNGDIEIRYGTVGTSTRIISAGAENETGTSGVQLQNGPGAPPSDRTFVISRITFRADAGGTYTITEGTPTVALSAVRSRGEIVSYNWDLDNDGEFDDAEGQDVEFDASMLDGPSQTTVGLQIVDVNDEVSTAEAIIDVINVPPTIVSTPDEVANVENLYTYQIVAEDPGAGFDPFEYQIVEAPEGLAIDETGLLTWTPGVPDFELTFPISIKVADGDDGFADQAWEVTVFAPDEDGDRIPDEQDNCVTVVNEDQLDNDEDGDGDACDDDDDNDTIPDVDDNCRFDQNTDQNDNDGTEGGDACDDDDDNDFIPDVDDNCPFVTNPDQSDSDENGEGDACQGDDDRDGIPSEVDNCPDDPNTNQFDLDEDGIGDVCDPDRDGDGLDNLSEEEIGTDPDDPDTDGDRLSDGDEVNVHGTDPTTRDTDEDGLDDNNEIEGDTDPNNPDSDGDGLDDGEELNELGTDPSSADTDQDGLTDGEELETLLTDPTKADSDNGGVDDGDEITNGTDPNNPDDDIADDGNNDVFNNSTGEPDANPDPDDESGGSGNTDEGCSVSAHHQPASGLPLALFCLLGLVIGLRRRH